MHAYFILVDARPRDFSLDFKIAKKSLRVLTSETKKNNSVLVFKTMQGAMHG